jgi:hypothetical protein
MHIRSFRKGDRVRFTGAALHASSPEYYPAPGVVGVYEGGGWVQWPNNATSGDDRWHAPDSALETAGLHARKRVARGVIIVVCPRETRKADVFTPHLEMHGERVGVIGAPTKFRDILGRPLAVGDIAEIFNRSNVSYGDNAVCQDDSPYVMGIKSSCDGSTGATGYWKLLRKRGHDEVRHGERIDGVLYVKAEAGGR